MGCRLETFSIEPFVEAGPFPHTRLSKVCYLSGMRSLQRQKVEDPRELRFRVPKLLVMGNFAPRVKEFEETCGDLGINRVYGENGFLPSQRSFHADPLGFCWQSSLPQMKYRPPTDGERAEYDKLKAAWEMSGSTDGLKQPYVIWLAQLLKDRTNTQGLNMKKWDPLIRDFREKLPSEVQLVVRVHPMAHRARGIRNLARKLPNTVCPERQPLVGQIVKACGVATANSTAVYEAGLLFGKPSWVYAKSWFDNHETLFHPVTVDGEQLPHVEELDCSEWLVGERRDYAIWFTCQLLARQHRTIKARHKRRLGPKKFTREFKAWLSRRTRHSWDVYGPEIFDVW